MVQKLIRRAHGHTNCMVITQTFFYEIKYARNYSRSVQTTISTINWKQRKCMYLKCTNQHADSSWSTRLQLSNTAHCGTPPSGKKYENYSYTKTASPSTVNIIYHLCAVKFVQQVVPSTRTTYWNRGEFAFRFVPLRANPRNNLTKVFCRRWWLQL